MHLDYQLLIWLTQDRSWNAVKICFIADNTGSVMEMVIIIFCYFNEKGSENK
jgi:hypothetical protein